MSAAGADAASAGSSYYTLAEISEATGIALPTLERYAAVYDERVPSAGDGRYAPEALEIFRQLRRENLEHIPLPRPGGRLLSLTAQRRARTAAAQSPAPGTELESAAEVEAAPAPAPRPRDHGSGSMAATDTPARHRSTGAPAAGDGPEAADASIARRLEALERSQGRLQAQLRHLRTELARPWTAIIDPF